jgi:hypothetical protein
VYNISGKEIIELVNGNLPAGKHRYEFNASMLTSGVYFYKLETPLHSQTRSMVLIK